MRENAVYGFSDNYDNIKWDCCVDYSQEFIPPKFEEFGKIPRLSRDCVITEKIDGTNAQILITEDGNIFAGSRTRWLHQGQDNHGFWKWVNENKEELIKELGIGRHFGEWWGQGINRGYGLKEKRFSLFNTKRWLNEPRKLCFVVPVLYEVPFTTSIIDVALDNLRYSGSQAAPGFEKPEGIVIYHKAANMMFKKTIEKDEAPKSFPEAKSQQE